MNKAKEALMLKMLDQMGKEPFLKLKVEMAQRQKEDVMSRHVKRTHDKVNQDTRSGELHHILCKTCQTEICNSNELKLYQNMNRIIVKEGLYNDITVKKRKVTQKIAVGVEKVGKLYHSVPFGDGICNEDLGGVLIIHKVCIPILKADNLMVRDPSGNIVYLSGKKKWKKLPFKEQSIETEDIPSFVFCAPEMLLN